MSELPRPTPLVFKCRVAIRDAAEAFWGRGWRLHDLKVLSPELHRRLHSALSRFDQACAKADDITLVRLAKELIIAWQAVAKAMPAASPDRPPAES
jgi:hypothetical protein